MSDLSSAALPPVRLAAGGRRQQVAFALLICGAIFIGFSPIFVRLSEIGPIATAVYRVLLALPPLWLWMTLEQPEGAETRPNNARDVAGLALAGALFAGDLAFWHLSVLWTSVANATLFANFASIFVTLLGWLLFRERYSRTFLAGMGLALLGAAALMGDSLRISAGNLVGDLLGIVTAMFYAGYILVVARLRRRFTAATIMVWSGAASAPILLLVALAAGEGLLAQTAWGWAVLAGLALVSHAGGQSLIAYALAHLPAAFSSVSLLVQPIAAALLGWLLLGERLGPWQAAGGAVILAGIWTARRGSR